MNEKRVRAQRIREAEALTANGNRFMSQADENPDNAEHLREAAQLRFERANALYRIVRESQDSSS